MAGDGKVPINASVRAAYSFLQTALPQTWRAGALLAAATTLLLTVGAADAAASLGVLFFAEAALLIYLAHLLRLALRQDGSGFLGLKFGADETRLLGVFGAVMFVIILVMLVGLIVFSTVLAMTLTRSGIDPRTLQNNAAAMEELLNKAFAGSDGIVLSAVIAFFAVLITWLLGRLSLAYAATIGEGRFMALSTFSWTRGNVLHVLVVLLLVSTPILTATLIIGSVPPAGKSGVFQILEIFALQLVQFCIQAPLNAGAYAFLYKGLRPRTLAPPHT